MVIGIKRTRLVMTRHGNACYGVNPNLLSHRGTSARTVEAQRNGRRGPRSRNGHDPVSTAGP